MFPLTDMSQPPNSIFIISAIFAHTAADSQCFKWGGQPQHFPFL